MFGASDDGQQSNDDPAMLDNVKQLASEPAAQVVPSPQFMSSSTPTAPVAQTSNNDAIASDTPHPAAVAEPAQGFSSGPFPDPSSISDSATTQEDSNPETTEPENDNAPIAAATVTPTVPVNTEHLAGMKQEALDHLEPLVGHLDQSPEEAFKTTMMMIQANDNHTLLEKALDEAKKIDDDKARANAMLDIINEINYFSQNASSN